MNKVYCLLIGYLFGSILFAVIVTKAHGLDVREIDPECPHRGNPGMANVMLNVGFKPGLVVLFGDALKVIIAMLISWLLFKEEIGTESLLYSGFGAILGHNFPAWRKFQGGKGVLVTIIWMLTVLPKYSWISIVLALIIVLVTGYLNLAAIVFPLAALPLAWFFGSKATFILFVLSAVLMLYTNRYDILNLIEHKAEKHLFFKKKQS